MTSADADPTSPHNFNTLFNSLPTDTAGYGETQLTQIADVSNHTLIAGGSSTNVAERYTADFYVANGGTYRFRAGGDEGYGAALTVDQQDLLAARFPSSQGSTDADMNLNGSFGDPTQYLQGIVPLGAGEHTLQWTGFEGCCNGSDELQYSTDGGDTWSLFSVTGAGFVPEPASWSLMLVGFGGLGAALRARRRAALA